MNVLKKMMSIIFVALMCVMLGGASFVLAKTVSIECYTRHGETEAVKGKSCTFKLYVKSGNKGTGTLYLKDPYLWHQWDYKYLSNGGNYQKSFPNVGSSRAYWKGAAENSKLTIIVS